MTKNYSQKIGRFFIFCICATMFAFTVNAQSPEKASVLLGDFDVKAAIKTMNQKRIPPSDRKGYMEYLKRKHIVAKDPTIYKKTTPKTVNITKNSNGISVFAATCNNVGFDDELFTNWTGATGDITFSGWTNGFVSNGLNAYLLDPYARHTILNTPPTNDVPPFVLGYDSIAINPNTGKAEIPLVAPGGGFVSVRLGNANSGSETERLRYTFTVNSSNAQLTYFYAVVLQDPQHDVGEQPFFSFKMFDSSNNPIGANCGKYLVDATSASSDSTFIKILYAGEDLYYKKWTAVTVDLSSYIGQTVTLDFQTADCTLGGHFGYAYIDLTCAVLQGTVGFCAGDSKALLVAPPGFASYKWFDSSNNPIVGPTGLNDSLTVNNPVIGTVYTVKMVSVTGCPTNLQLTINYSTITSSIIKSASCVTGTSGSATVNATGGSSAYTYLWNTTPPQTTKTATGLGAGTYIVKVTNNGCLPRYDTVTIGTKNSIPTSSTTYYCAGSQAWAIAPLLYATAPTHSWYQSNTIKGTNDTLIITTPSNGQVYTDSIKDTYGCKLIHKTTLSVTSLSLSSIYQSDTICGGDNSGYASVTVNGTVPANYSWNTSPLITGIGTSAYLSNVGGGAYTVVFSINGGCTVSTTIKIFQKQISDSTIKVNYKCGDSKLLIAPPSTDFGGFCGAIYYWLDGNGDTLKQNDKYIDTSFGFPFLTTVLKAGDTLNLGSIPNPSNGICLWKVESCDFYNCPKRYCYQFTLLNGGTPPPDSTIIVTYKCGDKQTVLPAPVCSGYNSSLGYGCFYYWLNSNGDTLRKSLNKAGDTLVIPSILSPGNSISLVKSDNYGFNCERKYIYQLDANSEGSVVLDSLVNVFSPNGDNVNDIFYPYYSATVKYPYNQFYIASSTITIFNRWGNIVYKSDDFKEGWDGKMNGTNVDAGIYYWISTYISACDDTKLENVRKGHLQLVR